MLLHGHGKIRPALDRRVIGDHRAFAPRDAARCQAISPSLASPPIQAMRGKLTDLEKGRDRIDQVPDTMPAGQAFLARDALRAAAWPPSETNPIDRLSPTPRRASALPSAFAPASGIEGQPRMSSSACATLP